MPDSAPSSRSSTRQVLASESRLRLLDIVARVGRGMRAPELPRDLHDDSRGRDRAESAHAAATKVNGLFAGLGFDPELRARPGWAELLLHACPFDAVVD